MANLYLNVILITSALPTATAVKILDHFDQNITIEFMTSGFIAEVSLDLNQLINISKRNNFLTVDYIAMYRIYQNDH